MTERTPLSGREYGALQSLFAVVSSWEVALPVLLKRAVQAGCADEAAQMQTLSGKVLDALLKTVPQRKLAHIREELAHVAVYVKVEAPGIKTNHAPNYAYLPVETLNELLNHMIREECVLCEADPDTAKKCKYRKLIESALPHSVGTDHGDHCMYSDMIIGLGVEE